VATPNLTSRPPAPGTQTPASGLRAAEVAERVALGRTNATTVRTSRTVGEIVRANVLTVFNGILVTLFVLVLATGRWQNGLFGLVVVANAGIGIVQELRAKRTLDRLAVLSAPRARVVREGSEEEIAVADVVLDDLLVLAAGDQVPADGVVRTTAGLSVDESLLTGESEPVAKAPVTPCGPAPSSCPAADGRRRRRSGTTPTRRGWPPRPAATRRRTPSWWPARTG
jgi:cation-transporting P-type ATPase E